LPSGYNPTGFFRLLAASCLDLEAVVAQLRVPGKTNEHKTALELLKVLPLKGTLITGDAAFTQRDFCAAMIEGGRIISCRSRRISPPGRRTSRRPSARLFPPRERHRRAAEDDHAQARDKGHGRLEIRRRATTTRLEAYLDWPVARPVCAAMPPDRLRRWGWSGTPPLGNSYDL